MLPMYLAFLFMNCSLNMRLVSPMQPDIQTSTPSTPTRATDESIDIAGGYFAHRLQTVLNDLHSRVGDLERQAAVTQQAIAFHQTRRSWTVKQLADDLQLNQQTILNMIALPEEHPKHLDTFQPGGTGKHLILPEHVYQWMTRNSADVELAAA